MKIYIDVYQEDGRPEYVELEMSDHTVSTITDFQKIIKIIWPDTNVERIWLSPASFSHGVRLTNIDVKQEHADANRLKEKAA